MLTLAEWRRERSLFQLLFNIPFFRHNSLLYAFSRWLRAKRRAAFRRVRGVIAERAFIAKPVFVATLRDIAVHIDALVRTAFANTCPHTYHSLNEYIDAQVIHSLPT